MAKKKTRPPKKHHYSSQFYLGGFVDPTNPPEIWVYRKEDGRVFSSGSEAFGFENHYNTFINAKGERDSSSIERMLCKIEGMAGDAIRTIRSRQLPSPEERLMFCAFVGIMILRTPRYRKEFQEETAEFLRMIGKDSVQDLDKLRRDVARYEKETLQELGSSVEELQRCVLEDELTWVVSGSESLRMFGVFDELADILYRMRWTYVERPPETGFISSDSPVVQIPEPPEYGLMDQRIQITFPLSSDLACIGTWGNPREECFGRATEEIAGIINRRTAKSATREVYASENSDAILRLLQAQ
ncbi:MAG TPA: DUF4238 domain-containing protein [Blastocatellia bacterium]|nr:DUF4238 domain-containing protein [Blastocatellia bacterium]